MTEIKDFSTPGLRNSEYFGFLTNVRESITYISDTVPQPSLAAFTAAYEAYDKVLKKDLTNSHTAKLNTASDMIDNAWRGIKKQSQIMTSYSDEAKKTAAEESYQIIERYGTVYKMGHNDKSSAIHNMLQDYVTYGTEKQELIGIKIWVDDLSKSYNKFVSEMIAQASEADEKGKGTTKKMRDEVDTEYRNLVKSVNSLAFINGDEGYKEFIGLVNVFIDDAKAVIAARKTRAANKKEEETANTDTAKEE